MRLILARHGNTFAPGDKVVWAGQTNDLPLVETGLQQAQVAANYLLVQGIKPKAIYCSPLQRTKTFAEILAATLNYEGAPIIDQRLHEIDYGEWTGRSDQEIIDQFGVDQLKEWSEFSRWPQTGSWGANESQIKSEVESFVKDIQAKYSVDDTIIAVSSNGRLRYFLSLINGEFERRRQDKTLKVKTGNICELAAENGQFALKYWDKKPNA